jgi:hypothetical protein
MTYATYGTYVGTTYRSYEAHKSHPIRGSALIAEPNLSKQQPAHEDGCDCAG